MAAARAWRQQHNNCEGTLDQSGPHPRSLTAMLANPHQGRPPDVSQKIEIRPAEEGELQGESELVALSEDWAPLFQTAGAPLCEVRRAGGNQDSSSRDLLTDLFPSGFTSRTLSPSKPVVATAAAAAARVDQPGSPWTNAMLGEKEPELKGRHAWTCLVPVAAAAVPFASVASSSRDNGGSCGGDEGEVEAEPHLSTDNPSGKHRQRPPHFQSSRGSSQQLHGCSELQELSHYGGSDKSKGKLGEFAAGTIAVETDDFGPAQGKNAITATRPEKILADDDHHDEENARVSDSSDQAMANKAETATVGERENQLKSALDRMVPRLLQSEERVRDRKREGEIGVWGVVDGQGSCCIRSYQVVVVGTTSILLLRSLHLVRPLALCSESCTTARGTFAAVFCRHYCTTHPVPRPVNPLVLTKEVHQNILERQRVVDMLDRCTHRFHALLFVSSGVSQVKFLEGSLEQAKHAESGRNALIKQVNKLEEEVKHLRHMLEKRHAEALVRSESLVGDVQQV